MRFQAQQLIATHRNGIEKSANKDRYTDQLVELNAPDLMAAFGRAEKERDENKEGDGSGSCLENARPPDLHFHERPGKDRDRE
ncbi:MAG: hypothetical protein ABI656_07630 [bacterium]